VRSQSGSTAAALLLCGAVAGPLFVVTVLVQDVTRAGFDPRIHLLSQLALGPWGWVQVANFVLAGALNVLYAVGLWRREHQRRSAAVASVLLGVFGLFLMLVGVFRTDPAHGFPPGAATPAQPTVSGVIHALGALFIFLSLTAAILILSLFHLGRGERRMAVYCLSSGILLPVIFVWAMSYPTLTGPALQVAVLIGWPAPSLTAVRLRRRLEPRRASPAIHDRG
jgi:hypothetical membrane protein